MKSVTREWIKKAEGDYQTAGLLLRARKHPNYDASCFHAQQCAEKYMKAVLEEELAPFVHSHDLSALLDRLTDVNPFWEALRPAATVLTGYAVRFRYPGSSADKAMAKTALQACELVRGTPRNHPGLSDAAGRKPKPKSRPRKNRRKKLKRKDRRSR